MTYVWSIKFLDLTSQVLYLQPHACSVIVSYLSSCDSRHVTFPCTAGSQFSASQFLKAYESEFLEVVNGKQSLLRLKHKGVIPPDISRAIEKANDEDAKYLLFEHLQKNATVATLREYCKVATEAEGYPRMNALGRDMMKALPPGGWLELCAWVSEYMWGRLVWTGGWVHMCTFCRYSTVCT